jgi:hypothetical protein
MKLSKLTIALYLTLIFLSGVAVGGFSHRLYTVSTVNAKTQRDPNEWRMRYINEMQSRLGLRADQVSALNGILDETRARFHETREKMQPEFEAVKQQQIAKVKAILSPSQQAEYDKMRQEREAREKAQGHQSGPGI